MRIGVLGTIVARAGGIRLRRCQAGARRGGALGHGLPRRVGPLGGLATSQAAGVCQTGSMGYAVNYGADVPAEFDSAPLSAPLTVGGSLSLKLYLVDPAEPLWHIRWTESKTVF